MLQAAACGGGDVFDDPVAAAQKDVTDQCNKAHECKDSFPDDPSVFEFFFRSTAAECIDQGTLSPEDEQALRDAIDAGRTIYDADATRECNEALLAATCEEFWNATAPEVCSQRYVGTLADGENCAFGAECASGFCDQGVCAQPPQF